MGDDKENASIISCSGDDGIDTFMPGLTPKDAFMMALRKAANSVGNANWTDVRHLYKKYTGGRHLNHEELGHIAGAQNKTRRELFQNEFAQVLTPCDAQGNVVRVHMPINKCHSPISFEGNITLPSVAQLAEANSITRWPSEDTTGQMDTKESDALDEPQKTTLVLRKDVPIIGLPKSTGEGSRKKSHQGPSFDAKPICEPFVYKPEEYRALPAVLATSHHLDDKIRMELEACRIQKEENVKELKKIRRLTQEIEEEMMNELTEHMENELGIATLKMNKASVEVEVEQPSVERIPTWEKNLVNQNTEASPTSPNSKMIREIETFLFECASKDEVMPTTSRVDEIRNLSRTADLPKVKLASVGIMHPPDLNDKASSKKKKHDDFHLMRQRRAAISCCAIL